jgi:hypothetical protein
MSKMVEVSIDKEGVISENVIHNLLIYQRRRRVKFNYKFNSNLRLVP